MDFSLSTVVDGDLAVVSVTGEIDMATAEPLRQALLTAEGKGCRHLVVDLTQVDFLDSTGLGALVGCLRRQREAGGDLSLAVTHPHLLKVLRVTNLDRVFPIYPSAAAAGVGAREPLAP